MTIRYREIKFGTEIEQRYALHINIAHMSKVRNFEVIFEFLMWTETVLKS
jgi:hypothetical protein